MGRLEIRAGTVSRGSLTLSQMRSGGTCSKTFAYESFGVQPPLPDSSFRASFAESADVAMMTDFLPTIMVGFSEAMLGGMEPGGMVNTYVLGSPRSASIFRG